MSKNVQKFAKVRGKFAEIYQDACFFDPLFSTSAAWMIEISYLVKGEGHLDGGRSMAVVKW